MSIRSQVKKEGAYPQKSDGTSIHKTKLTVKNHTILLVQYENENHISLYLGGKYTWCVHCGLVKENGQLKPIGYLVKIRYDMLCSLEEDIKHGGDIKQLVNLLIQHIHNTFPAVKELYFNDLSIRKCNNMNDVNLAVMTYLYTEKTWYERNFGAYIAQHNIVEWNRIIANFKRSKMYSWETIKGMITNYSTLPFTEGELRVNYESASSWMEFFEPIFKKLGIANFCIFVSDWLDMFISTYFNNLMGLTYIFPIKNTNTEYTVENYQGGRIYNTFFRSKSMHTRKRVCY